MGACSTRVACFPALSGEGVGVKSLRARFQNDETLKIRTKPTIPEKPKTLTSPTTKISNPLIATINSAMESRMPVTPRVVFKDEKKKSVKRQLSQPDPLDVRVKDPQVHPDLLDKNQKKEGDLIKQALKDKNLPLVLPVSPVTPVIQETPKPDPVPASPVLPSPVKISTPKKNSMFSFKKLVKTDEEKTDTSVPSSSTPVSVTHEVKASVAPKALVPPVQAEADPVSSGPAPIIPAPVISPFEVPEPKVLVLTGPEPDIVSQISPNLESSKPEIPNPHKLNVTLPQPDVSLSEEVVHPSEIPDILDIDIPPPVIPEDILEDIPDADISALNIPAQITPDPLILSIAANPVSSSPNLSRTASPAPAASASITPEPPVTLTPEIATPDSGATSVSSTLPVLPSPTTYVEPSIENDMAKFHEAVDQMENTPEVLSSPSSKTISALSALVRAEEMAPVRHNSCDLRVLNLLEKAKKKHTTSHQMPISTTPEFITSVETDPPSIFPDESSVHEKPHSEVAQAELVLPAEASPSPEILAAAPLDIPPVDYEDQPGEVSTVKSKAPSSETALTNGLHHRDASPVPKVLAEQSPAKVKAMPPPPPPRRIFPATPSETIAPEKPPRVISTDLQTILPAQPVEGNGIIIPAPVDFTSENSTFDDSEFDVSSEAAALDLPEAAVAENGNHASSVHEQAFLEQLSPEHQSFNEFAPNLESTEVDFNSEAQEADLPDLMSDPTVSPSPSGTQEMNHNSSDNAYEDQAVNKKGKTLKKPRKGTLMNPYADSPSVNEGSSRKTLFARKSTSPDDKELKKKEKQKEKVKEKEKEKEKKELKEKEKEKKEHKEKEKEKKEHKGKEKEKEKKDHKEKEKKEHKEKEKEKKELKGKEKEKKDQKEKEREKKEIKEKEREKKEQKEKEKKENEMKKKFKITGEEEALYQAKVRESCKGRKNDLAVKAGETVSIIRTTDCPKGKWLARDSNNQYGFVLVESVDLDIQEMMELGKRAKVSSRTNSNGFTDPEATSTGSRSSNHHILHQESFTDDSEEWCDEEDGPFTPTEDVDLHLSHTVSSLEMVTQEPDPAQQEQTDANDNVQTRQEALQKLASFFAQSKTSGHATLKRNTIGTSKR
ncbi:hypothetical protein NFI96_015510, partial [Prochilodus magdalenae]